MFLGATTVFNVPPVNKTYYVNIKSESISQKCVYVKIHLFHYMSLHMYLCKLPPFAAVWDGQLKGGILQKLKEGIFLCLCYQIQGAAIDSPPGHYIAMKWGEGGNSIVAPCMSIFVETFLPLYFPSNFPPKRSLGIDLEGLQKIQFHYFTLSSYLPC